jgi:hypothetical protein
MIQPLAEALAACEAAWAPRSDDPLDHTLKWDLGFDGSETIKSLHSLLTSASQPKPVLGAKRLESDYHPRLLLLRWENSQTRSRYAVMNFFENGRALLTANGGRYTLHEKVYPGDKHNIIPDPWLFCMERVNKTISDMCNQAALMQTLVHEKIKQVVIEQLEDEWDNMSEEDQQRVTAVEKSGCLHITFVTW